MNVSRYMLIPVIKTNELTFIPIWDEKIKYETSENYGKSVSYEGTSYYNLVEAVFDIKRKEISIGIIVDIYPREDQLDFKIGDNVLYNKESYRNVLTEHVVTDITFEEYNITIVKGKKLESYDIKRYKETDYYKKTQEEVVVDQLYAFKQWKPIYVLDNGLKIEYSHQLFTKK